MKMCLLTSKTNKFVVFFNMYSDTYVGCYVKQRAELRYPYR